MSVAKIHFDLQQIILFERGELDNAGTVALFAGLIHSGMVWQLQGTYGRLAQQFIEAGVIDAQGNIDEEEFERACNPE